MKNVYLVSVNDDHRFWEVRDENTFDLALMNVFDRPRQEIQVWAMLPEQVTACRDHESSGGRLDFSVPSTIRLLGRAGPDPSKWIVVDEFVLSLYQGNATQESG